MWWGGFVCGSTADLPEGPFPFLYPGEVYRFSDMAPTKQRDVGLGHARSVGDRVLKGVATPKFRITRYADPKSVIDRGVRILGEIPVAAQVAWGGESSVLDLSHGVGAKGIGLAHGGAPGA